MKSIVLINCYFGRFPNYFNLFLDSCRMNDTVNFLFFTDNIVQNPPENVNVINISFEGLKEMFKAKFDFEISLDAPYKLCDYKPAYGYVFYEYIARFDYWGYCDIDMIFGDIRHFLSDDILDKYDKFYKLGHLTVFRNTQDNNCAFMQDENVSYRKAFTTKKIVVFDEFNGIQLIFDRLGKATYFSRDYADITALRYRFTLSNLLVDNPINNNYLNQIFVRKNDRIYRYYELDGVTDSEEFAYIHLQKRRFKNIIKEGGDYLITCSGFIPWEGKQIDLECMQRYNGTIWYRELQMKYKVIEFKVKRKITKTRISIYEYFTSSVNW